MRAITYSKFGSASEALVVEEIDIPSVGAGEVLVRLRASGVNPSDIKARAGGRPGVTKPPFPIIIPHSDGAGEIVEVGSGVDESRVSERVWVWNGQWRRAFGTAAEYIVLPSDQAVLLPDHISFEQGAILGIPALTATHTVLGGGSVEGKTVLISGGAGTVGRLAVQVAKASGAKVFATVFGEAEAEAALSAGADEVFDYTSSDLAELILDRNNGGLIERVVEVEFGMNVNTIAAVIAEKGSIASYGSALRMEPQLPFYPLLFKAVKLEFVLIYLLNESERSEAIKNLTGLLNREALDLRIFKTFDLSECVQAHEMIESGNRAGSVVLTMSDK